MRVHGLTRRSLFRAGTLAGGGLAAPALLSGCGTGNPAAAAGNVLRVSQTADTTMMDPQKQGDMTSMNVLINIFDTLTARSLSNTLAPGLARSWRIVDEKTWRFVLRQGVRFHNVGRIVELADTDDLFAAPRHPYTRALLSAIPVPDPVAERSRRPIVLRGDPPSPIDPPPGCPFHPRCPAAQDDCRASRPALVAETGGRHLACHHPDDAPSHTGVAAPG